MANPGGGALSGLVIRPLAPSRVEDVRTITRGSWGSQCWDMHPRYTSPQKRELGMTGKDNERKRREVLAKLARRRRNTPLLVAYVDREPAGFVSLGPRTDFAVVAKSRATPPVDELDAWVIPCLTVRRGYRGMGIAVALLRAAVDYAAERGAEAVDGYPRADGKRVHDDFAFIGTEALFKKAGYRKVRGVMKELPRGWTPRVTMRAECRPVRKASPRSRTRSRAAS